MDSPRLVKQLLGPCVALAIVCPPALAQDQKEDGGEPNRPATNQPESGSEDQSESGGEARQPDLTPEDQPNIPEPPPPLFYWIEGGYEHAAATDFDNFDGEVSINRIREQFGLQYIINPQRRQVLRTSFTAEQSFYDFDGEVNFEPGTDEPWKEIRDYTLFALYSEAYNEDIRWFAGGTLNSSGERGADFDGTLTYSVIGGVSFQVAEGVWVGPGVAASKRIENGFAFIPIPIVEWQINEEFSLGTAEAGLVLKYKPVDEWTFSLKGQFDRRQFRLNDEGPAANGVVTEQRVPLLAGVEWNPSRSVSVSLEAGPTLFTEYELSRPGVDITSDSSDSFIIGFRAQFRF